MFFEMRFHGDVAKKVLYPFYWRAEAGNIFLSPDEGLTLTAPSPNGCLIPVLKITPDSVPSFICEDCLCAAIDLVELYQALSGTSHGDTIYIHLEREYEQHEPPHHLELQVWIEKFETDEAEQYPVELAQLDQHIDFLDDSEFEYAILIAIPQRVLNMFAELSRQLQFPQEVTVHVTVTSTRVSMDTASFYVRDNIDLTLNQEDGHCLIGGAATEGRSHFSFILSSDCAEYFTTRVSEVAWLCLSHDSPALIVVPAPSFGNLHLYTNPS